MDVRNFPTAKLKFTPEELEEMSKKGSEDEGFEELPSNSSIAISGDHAVVTTAEHEIPEISQNGNSAAPAPAAAAPAAPPVAPPQQQPGPQVVPTEAGQHPAVHQPVIDPSQYEVLEAPSPEEEEATIVDIEDVEESEFQMDPNALALEISQARGDVRSYVTSKISSEDSPDLAEIRVVEQVIQSGDLPIEELPVVIAQAQNLEQKISQQLILRNIISDEDFLSLKAGILNIESVHLADAEVELSIAKLLNPNEAAEWQALPYSRNDLGGLLVAISDPENTEIKDNITKKFTDEDIVFRLASANELGAFIERIYDPNAAGAMAEIMEQIESEASDSITDTIHVRETDETAPVIRLVQEIIRGAKNLGASDIHIEAHENHALVRMRVDSMLRDFRVIDKALEPRVISLLKTKANMRPDEKRVPQDGRISYMIDNEPLDLRVATIPVVAGVNKAEQITMRLLDPKTATIPLEKLGMSEGNLERYMEGISRPHGCCFITGPTGSGKSTTLYSTLSRVTTKEKKTMTIEDPVEYRFDDISQTDISGGARDEEDAGKLTFAKVLKSILRSDPDTVMVGEIRDFETATVAIDAALTGHFLYSTLHTNDAISSITRLEKMGVERFLIAASTEVIVAQRLIRRLCSCKKQVTVDEEFLQSVVLPADIERKIREGDSMGQVVYRPSAEGCAECQGMGYKGRTGVHEVIVMTEELRSAIEAGASEEEMRNIARAAGMGSLLDDAFVKVLKGETSFEETVRVVQ